MGYKAFIRRAAKFVLASQPQSFVTVHTEQIHCGSMLSGRNIVITGGARGLGLAMAKKFLSEGARVLIASRSQANLDKALSELGGGNCKTLAFDVCEAERSEGFIRTAAGILGGRIDDFVSNAGVSLHENQFTKVTVEGFDRQFDTNFRAGYFLGKAFLEYKLNEKSPGGQLLFITSETGDQCYDIPYGMTKAALNSLTGAFSRRVYTRGIRVNAIAPGVTLTDMTKEYASSPDGNLYRDCASGRTFLPEEVAEVACFMLSGASKCISGEVIHCNAGNHLKAFWDKSGEA